MLLAFHKPFGILSQFTGNGSPHGTLAQFDFPAGVYPIGRLDADSEGLLLLSDEPELNQRLLHPSRHHRRVYWVQVEGVPTVAALGQLVKGVRIQGRSTLPGRAWQLVPPPDLPPRNPPVRIRKSIPTTWIALELIEGKNRQVRRMTAVVGHPTLRLVRVRIGGLSLAGLNPGAWRPVDSADRRRLLEPASFS